MFTVWIKVKFRQHFFLLPSFKIIWDIIQISDVELFKITLQFLLQLLKERVATLTEQIDL